MVSELYYIHDNIKTIELVENLLKVAYEILFSFTIPNLISWGKPYIDLHKIIHAQKCFLI